MLTKTNKSRGVIIDIAYSGIAYALPTAVLQIIAMPMIARHLNANMNGLFLTILSGVRLMIAVFIVSLSNLRLIDKKNCNSDAALESAFNALALVSCVICSTLALILTSIYSSVDGCFEYILVLLFTLFYCLHDYYAIQFRVEIDFLKILIDNTICSLGLLLGLLLFRFVHYWQVVFIVAYFLSTLYVFLNTDSWKKGIDFANMGVLVKRHIQLGSASGLNSAIAYCDRLIMFPVLGGAQVSIYNSASVVSKVVSLVSVPINNVLLSHIVDKEENCLRIRKNLFIIIILAVPITLLCIYCASVVLCMILYPMYYRDAATYIPMISFSVLVESLSSIMNVALMRFELAGLQTRISTLKIAAYLTSMFVFVVLLRMGLNGFCIALLFSSMFRMIYILIKIRPYIEYR